MCNLYGVLSKGESASEVLIRETGATSVCFVHLTILRQTLIYHYAN